MKAERRHDLKTNTLARSLEELPNYSRQYGSRILLAITVALLAFVGIRYWRDSTRLKQERLAADVETVRNALSNLNSLPYSAVPPLGTLPPQELVKQRQSAVADAEKAISDMIETGDAKTRADGYVARGDLNWELANLPEIPGAQTQPSLKVPKGQDALLEDAKTAYHQVLSPPLNEQHDAVLRARFALAAVAENQAKWDEARTNYQAISDDPNTPKEYKDYAKSRMDLLPQLQEPVLVGKYTPPAPATTQSAATAPSAPTTAPAASQPATTQSATTQSAAPSTNPAQTRPGQ